MNRVLIYDCDGVLGDTEQFGHLPAFNQMWKELGVPWQWSVEQYGEKLKIGGGKERMLSLFQEEEFLRKFQPPREKADQEKLVASWHKRKSEIYRDLVLSGKIPPRSGVKRLAEEALSKEWKVVVASTSKQESVQAVIDTALGDAVSRNLSLLLAGDIVKNKKPAPDIYKMVSKKLDISPENCITIEDSRSGMLSAVGAGIKCVITVNGYTKHEDFSDADLVLSCLGDPDGEVCTVIVNRSTATPGAYLTVADLEAVMTS